MLDNCIPVVKREIQGYIHDVKDDIQLINSVYRSITNFKEIKKENGLGEATAGLTLAALLCPLYASSPVRNLILRGRDICYRQIEKQPKIRNFLTYIGAIPPLDIENDTQMINKPK